MTESSKISLQFHMDGYSNDRVESSPNSLGIKEIIVDLILESSDLNENMFISNYFAEILASPLRSSSPLNQESLTEIETISSIPTLLEKVIRYPTNTFIDPLLSLDCWLYPAVKINNPNI